MKYLRGEKINQIDIADDFFDAYKRCLNPNKNKRIVSIPAFVNGLFACELYLKFLSDKEINHEHDIKNIYNSLNDEIKKEIQKVPCNKKYNLDQLLKDIGKGFVEWRYIFEDDNHNFGNDYPFEYTQYFLETYLPVLSNIAHCKKK